MIQFFPFTRRGQNCLHVLSKHAKQNASIIFNLLMEVASNYPINKQDAEGNTGA